MQKKWIIVIIIIALLVAFLAWLFTESSKPLPGQKQADLGRKHVPSGTKVEYNSNPPTSGDHYADWIRSGVYESPKDDGNLVHSLEHGYVIMSYKCNMATSSAVIANEVKQSSQDENNTQIATSPAAPRNDDKQQCDERKNQLAKVYENKSKRKLIVVPRPNLDTTFALTAWTYLDKFNEFDQTRIEKFIDAHLNQGPEKTME